jgi:beta-lactamase regulating signal transducer with metallopeptidase domain
MDHLLEIGVSNAAAAAVLAVLAGTAGLAFRRPALTHALWLLVLLKLVTPPLFRVEVPRFAEAAANPVLHDEANTSADAPTPVVLPSSEQALAPAVHPDVSAPAGVFACSDPLALDWLKPIEPDNSQAAEIPEESEPLPLQIDWYAIVGSSWVIGSLAWFSLAGWRLSQFQRGLHFARPASAALQRRVAELSTRLRLRQVPLVLLMPGRVAPMLWAIGGSPRLLVPVGLLSDLQATALDTLLLHELAHLKRRDHWVRLLEFAAVGLYWWNPLVWLARRALREAEEQCCDAWVVATLPHAGRTYAEALVDTLDFLSARPALPSLACGIGPVSDLKRRLKMILRGDTPRSLSWPVRLGLLALAAAVLPMLPGWVLGQAPAKETVDEKRFEKRYSDDRRFEKKSSDELSSAEEELARAYEVLKKKLSELEAKRKDLQKTKTDQYLKSRPEGGTTIRIEISGLAGKPEEIKKLIQQLEKVLPGDKKRVIILSGQRTGVFAPTPQQGQGIFWGGVRGKPDPRLFKPDSTPNFTRNPVDPAGPGPRVESLDKKLDTLLKEIEMLRRELRKGNKSETGEKGPNPKNGITREPTSTKK